MKIDRKLNSATVTTINVKAGYFYHLQCMLIASQPFHAKCKHLYQIPYVDLHHHDSCDVSYASSAFCTADETANWIRIENNLGIKITSSLTKEQSPGEHVNTLTRRSKYSGMTIVVPANIGNHVIKYKRLVMVYSGSDMYA